MDKLPKYLRFNKRTNALKSNADKMMTSNFFEGAIMYYLLYIEQIVTTTHLYITRKENIDQAVSLRKKILEGKKYQRFSKIFDYAENIDIFIRKNIIEQGLIDAYELKDDVYGNEESAYNITVKEMCEKLNKIRNVSSSHLFFVSSLDPSNVWKRNFDDINYYRKIARKLRNLMRNDLKIEPPSILDNFIEFGSPIAMSGSLDEEFYYVESKIIEEMARETKRLSYKITEDIESTLPLLKRTNKLTN